MSLSNEPFVRTGKRTFTMHDELDDGLKLSDVGHEQTVSGHRYGPAVREYYLLHVIRKGCGKFVRGGVEYALKEGDAFLIRPMEVTVYTADKTDPWEYYWIGFSGENADKIAQYTFLDDRCVFSLDKKTVVDFYSSFSPLHQGESDDLMLRSVLFGLLSGIRKSVVGVSVESTGVVEQALRFINSNYFRAISVSGLASELNVTRSYFTTLFTEKVGESPYNYLTKLRIEKAKSLFGAGTGLTVSEVAYSVGFASLERFSEMFKKYVGVSPKEFRLSLL